MTATITNHTTAWLIAIGPLVFLAMLAGALIATHRTRSLTEHQHRLLDSYHAK